MVEPIPLRDLEDRVLAEHAALDHGGERGGDDHAREQRLVERADDLLDRERDRRDRRVERGGDPRGRADRQQQVQLLLGHPREAPHRARDTGADLHRRTLAPEGRARADLERADDELPDRVAELEAFPLHRVGDLDLRDPAAPRPGHEEVQEHARDQRPDRGCRDQPCDPRLPRRREGAIDGLRLHELNALMECDGDEAADPADRDGETEHPLTFGGAQPEPRGQPGEAAEIGARWNSFGWGHRRGDCSTDRWTERVCAHDNPLERLIAPLATRCVAGRLRQHASGAGPAADPVKHLLPALPRLDPAPEAVAGQPPPVRPDAPSRTRPPPEGRSVGHPP